MFLIMGSFIDFIGQLSSFKKKNSGLTCVSRGVCAITGLCSDAALICV